VNGDAVAVEAVRSVVAEVLGRADVEPTDDFFAIGGHSLLILRVVRTLLVEHGIVLDARYFGVNAQLAALGAACRKAPPG
jgi:Phosphopantetheine attachment site